VNKSNLGSAVRTVKATAPSNPGSELLEQVDPVKVNEEIRYLNEPTPLVPLAPRRLQRETPPPGKSLSAAWQFIQFHCANGRHAAAVVRAWVPWSLAIAALCTAGFIEGMITALVVSLFAVGCLLYGFVLGLIAKYRKPNVPQETDRPSDAGNAT
jgi:hypothetical protein